MMGTVEEAVDAAANFVGPFLERENQNEGTIDEERGYRSDKLVEQALVHLHSINTAEKAQSPDAPYDASLYGIVYGLLDLVTTLGIVPFLSPGVAFSQRPRSVLISNLPSSPSVIPLLQDVLKRLIPIFEQDGTGVQPILSQRILPDLISAVSELAWSPNEDGKEKFIYESQFYGILRRTATSRLLPILTSYLQQDIPPWLRQRLSHELAMIPLRNQGIRHTVEFLSLSLLSKNSRVSQEQTLSLSQIPIPLDAISQTSRLLAAVPSGTIAQEWFTSLAPQLWGLVDGNEGKDLSRAAGQIIAGGILSRKSTGAPGAIGWDLFAKPLLEAIQPDSSTNTVDRRSTSDRVVVGELDLKLALKRLEVIVSSYSQPGLIKRLVAPLLLPLWGLLDYSSSRPALDIQWKDIPRTIILRYMSVALDPKHIDIITTHLFWDGSEDWTYGPGSEGGIEIRQRLHDGHSEVGVSNLLSKIAKLDGRVQLLLALLTEAKVDDEAAGAIFLNTAKRWLLFGQSPKNSHSLLAHEDEMDPLDALTFAKLSEAMATKFQEKFARSPQHILELMSQLIHEYAEKHMARKEQLGKTNKATRANLGSLLQSSGQHDVTATDTESEDLVSFALSIITTVITSPKFDSKLGTLASLSHVIPDLRYLCQSQPQLPIPSLIVNAAANLAQNLQPKLKDEQATDSLVEFRKTLKAAFTDLTSSEPPMRTWALTTLRKLIQDSAAFPLIDVPSTAHLLLSVSIADPESYVHLAAIPVVVDLVTRAPNPTLRILIDAFIDIDEQSLRLKKEKDIIEALDFRLRVGETLNNVALEDAFWNSRATIVTRHNSLKMMVEATLSMASRRGQRHKTLSTRNEILDAERKEQEEGERAWGGPIPNLLDPEAENEAEQGERDALFKIVQGWEDTGVEEDVRVRASSLSILSSILEKRLELLSQIMVDAAMQMVLLILTMETGAEKAILRRAAVLVIMGLLRGMDVLLEDGKESAAGLEVKHSGGVDQVMKWLRDEDHDDLVRGHAESVLEGLETWRMKRLYKVRDEGITLGPNLGLDGNLRGLEINLISEFDTTKRQGPIVEEIE
ncbi:hypothetical protein EJ04DRAFT_604494 [Polyplosphaeria fusca]|uniref:RNA polymerase II assembly factor Rtp1 C-terminal domain-containing protein n=1 Tax=Polyplosphaeria fusca TaxID=682080 RepID=A0A9P4RAP9_9PLEO|nr:hypothetical protein EJ04DRAFT_604494 [Polyplosphaeria fusca]